ncbi:MAG: ATP-binding protein [Candidatus Magnetobacterium sp. LHC-1]|nr:ATP-binding protein [Nitrospirota bacterium]
MAMSEEEINEQREKLSNYSSKIKRIYLELHGYSFFHGHSEVDNIDSRFIGRKRLIERLRNVLTNDKSKSGAYLVTGFRGMGKTSLVSKVINELIATERCNLTWTRFLLIGGFIFLAVDMDNLYILTELLILYVYLSSVLFALKLI